MTEPLSDAILLEGDDQGPPGPGGLSSAAAVATSAANPTQLQANTFTPFDSTFGPVAFQAPRNAVADQLFAIGDHSGVSTLATITALDPGVTIQDPSWTGVGSPFATTVHLTTPLGVQRWRFFAPTLQWIFDN